MLADFATAYPQIQVDYQPVAGDYPAAMTAKFSAGEPPDLFYVNSSVAPEWIDEERLGRSRAAAAERGFDTSAFFPGYLDAFRGPQGGVFGFPKDGNTLAMAYNTSMLEAAGIAPPTNWTELEAAATALTTGDTKAFCLNHSLDRALAFIYQNGGSLLSDNKTQNTLNSPETRAALTTYLGWFTGGQASRAADLGDDWCGKSLGEGKVAMIFEGGWVDPYMAGTSIPARRLRMGRRCRPVHRQGDARLHGELLDGRRLDRTRTRPGCSSTTYTGPEGHDDLDRGWRGQPVAQGRARERPGKEILIHGRRLCPPSGASPPGFSAMNDAFNNAMTAAIEAKSDGSRGGRGRPPRRARSTQTHC